MNLASIFTANMVLQQGIALPIWGTAKPGEAITVCFADQEKTTTAGGDGRWQLMLEPLSASFDPRTLTVAASGESVTLSNILVGEVWVCSGQSNMEFSMANTKNADAEIPLAQFPNIRIFTVPKRSEWEPQSTIPDAAWKICTPETASQFSAVAYFFGRELHNRLTVPIGLINGSWGGTIAEAWTSRESLLGEPTLRDIVDSMDENKPRFKELRDEWQAKMDAINNCTTDAANIGFPRGWADLPNPDGDWQKMELPGAWQNRGHKHSGIFWFRKEVELPAGWAGKDLQLSIGAADKSETTFFNNEKVGSLTMKERPDAWSIQRTYTIPGRLVKTGRNIIAVRVHSDMFNGGLTGPAEAMLLKCPSATDTAIPLAGTWLYAIEANYGLVELPPEPMVPGNANMPCGLYNGMIAPLLPYAIRGVIWYQGESNAGRAQQYQTLFPTLIRNWRNAWGLPDLAFHFVQLANFNESNLPAHERHWPSLREAQTMTLALPHTGMAVAIDVGEPDDIHPRNKQDVGLRLALNALYQTYGDKAVVPCGPMFKTAKRTGDSVRVSFNHPGGGLACRGEKLQGFAIAGIDRKFSEAEARIDGEEIVVSSPSVPAALEVRYAWADNPVCNLYNAEGLPAAPFRTDNW